MAEARWLEIALTVSGELAEAVADVLDRYVSNGVVIESDVKFYNDEDEGTPSGPVRIYGYLFMDETLEEKRNRVEEALWHLGQIQALPKPEYRYIKDENWMAAWKKHYRPIKIGQRLLILPAWIEPEDQKRLAIRIDPSMAFGTGTHPSTQLCLELIEKYTPKGQTVIDIGCGSGILSIGALRMGASKALAVDIDPAAVKSTLSNAALNDLEKFVESGVGSVTEVLAGNYSLKSSPLVLANILAPVIIRLLDGGLADLVETGGALILAGILAEQAEGVRVKAEEMGLIFLEQRQIDDWVALAMQRK